jgi:hypothetical protein
VRLKGLIDHRGAGRLTGEVGSGKSTAARKSDRITWRRSFSQILKNLQSGRAISIIVVLQIFSNPPLHQRVVHFFSLGMQKRKPRYGTH